MTNVRISGLSGSQEVQIDGDSVSVEDALAEANVQADGLDVKVNGERVESLSANLENGDQVVVAPRSVKLGRLAS